MLFVRLKENSVESGLDGIWFDNNAVSLYERYKTLILKIIENI